MSFEGVKIDQNSAALVSGNPMKDAAKVGKKKNYLKVIRFYLSLKS